MIINLINANSPMTYDSTMLGAAKVYARANQATIITPFILAGAMSPVTVAGTAAQTLAEAMSGMAFVQLVSPGAPVVLGSFASSISMQSGAPTFGTPEPALVLFVMAALARRLGVPFRSGGALCGSKIPDAQAAYESANTLLPTCLGGVNFVLHTAGWLEGGLAMGYEKFVMDVDQAGMMHTLLAGVDLSDNGQAMDAIREVGPGQALPRLRAHAGQLRDGVLPLAHRRQQQCRAVGSRRQPGSRAARQRELEEAARELRGPAARPGRRRSPAGLHESPQGDVRRFQVLINWSACLSRSAGVRGKSHMRHSLQSRCSPGIIASILASALCAAPEAAAEIFKCFAKDKTPIYQNFPCQFASNPEVTKMAFVPPAVSQAASQAKPKAAPVNVAPPVKQPDPGEPSVGMAQDEIRTLLGEPMEIVQDDPAPGVETWRYVNRSLQFDSNQRVVDLQSW